MRWALRIGAGTAALGLLLAAGAPVFTNDVFWHVTTGDHLLTHGLWPGADPFSFTAGGQSWVLHEWLTQVLFAAVHAIGGLPGLRLLTVVLTAGVLLLAVRSAQRRVVTTPLVCLALVLFAALVHARIQTRPTLLTLIAFLVLVPRLLDTATPWRRRDAVLLIALQLLWTNAHSVALAALPLMAVFVVGRILDARLARAGATSFRAPEPGELRRLSLTLFGMAAATLCTPAGTTLWSFAWQDKGDVMQYVADEWAPFSFVPGAAEALPLATYLGVWCTTALLALGYLGTALALHRAPHRLRSPALPAPSRVLTMLALFGAALLARRFHWLCFFVALASLESLRVAVREIGWSAFARGARVTVARALLALGCLCCGVMVGARSAEVEGRSPFVAACGAHYWTDDLAGFLHLDALDFLVEAGMQGNVVCHYNSGGLISWRGYPRLRVLIDSRIDLYRRDIYLDYVAVRDGRPDQQAILDRYGANIYFRHWDLAPPVDKRAWIPTFKGKDGEVWLRRDATTTAANLELARAWSARHAAQPPR